MPSLENIQAAMAEGKAMRNLYARLRITEDATERAALLRQADECVDSLRKRLQELTAPDQDPGTVSDDEMREAMGQLGRIMQQVMAQEREYRLATGGFDDAADEGGDAGFA